MKRESTIISSMTLRTRLFFSYLLLLVISLAVLTGALLWFLGSQPAPPHLTWQRLEAVLPALTTDIFQDANRFRNNDLAASLDSFAMTNEVRVLMVTVEANRAVALYDSSGVF